MNIHLQCPSCNKWGSGNLIEYRKAIAALYGEEAVSRMENVYRSPPKYSAFDLELMVKEYQKKLASAMAGA